MMTEDELESFLTGTAMIVGRAIAAADGILLTGRGDKGTGSCENFDTGEESTVYPAVIGSGPTTRRQR